MEQGIQQTIHLGPKAHQAMVGPRGMQNIPTLATSPKTTITRGRDSMGNMVWNQMPPQQHFIHRLQGASIKDSNRRPGPASTCQVYLRPKSYSHCIP